MKDDNKMSRGITKALEEKTGKKKKVGHLTKSQERGVDYARKHGGIFRNR